MMVVEGRIKMSDEEWVKFQNLNWAPWKPRTPAEFNAMCDLASARHIAENTEGLGEVFAIATDKMKFGASGEINFPEDPRRLEYVKVHGSWPTDAELAAFESSPILATGLKLVRNSSS
ncbi:MAG: hypothetical protein Q7U28_09245 [Aquabacterium sp.]|nr:hypothetical protein [Aquabacterium sp.]